MGGMDAPEERPLPKPPLDAELITLFILKSPLLFTGSFELALLFDGELPVSCDRVLFITKASPLMT